MKLPQMTQRKMKTQKPGLTVTKKPLERNEAPLTKRVNKSSNMCSGYHHLTPAQIRRLSYFDEIEVPEREYGYRTKPIEWDELVQIIAVEKNLSKLCRSVEQQRIYMVFRDELLKEYSSVYDHILVSKFDFQKKKVINEAQEQRWQAYPPLDQIEEPQTALAPNDFPYFTADCIQHWCLWKIGGKVTLEEVETAKQQLKDMHKHDEEDEDDDDVVIADFLCWRNPAQLMSMPGIDHYQILCRTETTRKTVKSTPVVVGKDNDVELSSQRPKNDAIPKRFLRRLSSSLVYEDILHRFYTTGTTTFTVSQSIKESINE